MLRAYANQIPLFVNLAFPITSHLAPFRINLVKQLPLRKLLSIMKKLFTLAIAAPLLFASCAQQSLTGDTYSLQETGRSQSVNQGRVTSVRFVKIQGNTQAGTIIGGIAGALVGKEVGSGSTANTIGGIAGAGLGAVAGSRIQQAQGSKQGLEITVKLESGRSISTVQESNPREAFNVGDRVRVLSNGSKTRITH